MIHMLPNREKGTDIKKHGEQSEEYNEWKIKKRNKKTCKENESKTEQKEAWQTTLTVHVWLCDCVIVCMCACLYQRMSDMQRKSRTGIKWTGKIVLNL